MNLREVIKSPGDICNYKIITLKNKLNVLMISNEYSKYSYAAMNVRTGSLMETTTKGLAHFLEHMLFMGNKKYPDGSKFFEFINVNGGKTNAFTDSINTCYYLSILNKNFSECLDMFAHFFIEPTFQQSCIDKEINAVNSEYLKDRDLDIFKYKQALKLITHDTHPFYNFDIGSNETLRKQNIREELINFYNKYYHAENMQLILIHKEPIEIMENMIKIFSEIPTKKSIEHMFGDPFKCNNIVKLVPLAKSNTLNLIWAIPVNSDLQKYKILRYIYYQLGRESKGSLSHILINNNLINDLHVFTFANFGDFSVICMDVVITDYGYANIDIILGIINEYISSLKISFDFDNFKAFEKCIVLNSLYGDNKKMNDSLMKIISNLCMYNMSLVDAASMEFTNNYDNKDNIKQTYEKYLSLLDGSRRNIILGSRLCMLHTTENEPLFNFKYTIEHFDSNNNSITYKFDNIHNFDKSYLPKKLIVYSNKESFSVPIRLVNEINLDGWFNYEKNKNPFLCVIVEMIIPTMFSNINNFVCYELFLSIINKQLRSDLYDSVLCNTEYSLFIIRDRLYIKLFCFNDISRNILQKIFECLTTFDEICTYPIFTFAKHDVTENYENTLTKSPYEKLTEYIDERMYAVSYPTKECLDKIKNIHFEDFKNMTKLIKQTLENCKIKFLINGNTTRRDCSEICKIFKSFQNNKTSKQHDINDNWKIEPKQYANDNEENKLFCTLICSNNLKRTSEDFMIIYSLTCILNKVMSDKFFDQLRTKAQLGYIVKSSMGIVGISDVIIYQKFIIQSSQPMDIVYEKIMDFFKLISQNMSLYNIDECIASCISELCVTKETLVDRTIELFEPIRLDTYDFDLKKKIIDILHKITPKDVQNYYNYVFMSEHSKKVNIII